MTTNAQTNSAKKLHGIFSDLWPLLPMEHVGIVIDGLDWLPHTSGLYRECIGREFAIDESFPENHAASILLDPYGARHLIVIDPVKTMAQGGWREFLQTGLHELAHAARTELAEGLYPPFIVLQRLTEYLETHLGNEKCDDPPPVGLFVTDDLMNEIDRRLFPADGSGQRPLFGKWVVRTDQHDGDHDLLFYLVLYMLEREATDRGYFGAGVDVVRSVYMPDRVDAVLGSGPEVAP